MKANSFGRVFKPICSIVRAREREKGREGKERTTKCYNNFQVNFELRQRRARGRQKRRMRGKINTATSAANGILIN